MNANISDALHCHVTNDTPTVETDYAQQIALAKVLGLTFRGIDDDGDYNFDFNHKMIWVYPWQVESVEEAWEYAACTVTDILGKLIADQI